MWEEHGLWSGFSDRRRAGKIEVASEERSFFTSMIAASHVRSRPLQPRLVPLLTRQ